MKLKHIAIIGTLFPILFSLVLFFGVLISADSDDENSNFSSGITGMNLSAEVLKHQPMVEKFAREYGISEYVNVLLATAIFLDTGRKFAASCEERSCSL